MTNTNETIADIIAAMRDEGHTGESSCLEWVGTKMRYYSDRLEAAWKREKATAEKSSVVGNAAKMREALVEARKVIKAMGGYWATETLPIIDTALAAPPRNCDVGTAEEQTKRLRANCEQHKPTCKGCKCFTDIRRENCWLKWAQMPYGEGASS
jgi:hypothetical protein